MRIFFLLFTFPVVLIACEAMPAQVNEADTLPDQWTFNEDRQIPVQVIEAPAKFCTVKEVVNNRPVTLHLPGVYRYGRRAGVIRRSTSTDSGDEAVSSDAPLPFDSVVNDFVTAGLFTTRPPDEDLNDIGVVVKGDRDAFVQRLLGITHAQLHFDGQTVFPVAYDVLLRGFAECSQGVLTDMVVLNRVEHTGATCKYTVNICYKGYGFVGVLNEESSDWFDMGAVNSLLDELLCRSGSDQRFVRVKTGDQTVRVIFGVPAKVKWLIGKYGLDYNNATSAQQIVGNDDQGWY